MKRIFILFLLVIVVMPAFSYSPRKLSRSAEISLITCSSGDELYSIFGHSAIRVYDDSLRINEVYNYGTFDFDTPGFYLKFANGKLDYMLSAYNFKYFLPSYIRHKRGVTEQVLNLTQNEKQKLYRALEINKLPENKYYRYDFFFDNCATRIRDIVLNSLDGEEVIYENKDKIDMTFRNMLHLYLDKQPWTKLEIDLVLGSKIDRKVTEWESAFLPDYLKSYFLHTYVKRNGEITPLVISERELLKFPEDFSANTKITPVFVSWMLFVLFVFSLFYEKRSRKRFLVIERLLLFVTGIIGLVVFYLWFLTEHTATVANYNILWLLPTNLVLLFGLKKLNKKGFFRVLGLLTLISLLIVLAGWKLIPQELPLMAIPVSLILFIRLTLLLFSKRQAQ